MKLHVFYLIDGEYQFKELKAVDEISMYENVGIYAYTSDKEFAKIFQETHDMNKFIHKIIENESDKIMKKLLYENDDKELFMYDILCTNGVEKILMTEFENNLVVYGFPEVCYDLTVDKGRFVSLDEINKYKKKFSMPILKLNFDILSQMVGWTDSPSEYGFDLESSMHMGEWDQASIYRFIFSDLLKEV